MPSRVLAIGLAFMCLAGNIQPARLAARAPLRQPGPSPRPSQSMFQSEPGTPHAIELQFDRQTGVVTITLSVEDPDGYFIPNLRPENFAVYQDGVPQTNATVDIDHAAVSLFVLLEGGGRYQELNKFLNIEIPSILHPLLDALVSNDKTAMLSYAHGVKVLADLGSPRDQLLSVITHPQISGFSEANLYDALRDTLARTGYPSGRRALLLISTGIDSFSHTTFDEVVADVKRADTPIYCIGLGGRVLRSITASTGPLSKIDWARANSQLKTLATVSNGRTYVHETDLAIPAVYDDMMEHLRVRYVITYKSVQPSGGGPARKVSVALIDPRAGGPLRVTDSAGKAVTARISAEARYVP